MEAEDCFAALPSEIFRSIVSLLVDEPSLISFCHTASHFKSYLSLVLV
jgi:hypothetical protein